MAAGQHGWDVQYTFASSSLLHTCLTPPLPYAHCSVLVLPAYPRYSHFACRLPHHTCLLSVCVFIVALSLLSHHFSQLPAFCVLLPYSLYFAFSFLVPLLTTIPYLIFMEAGQDWLFSLCCMAGLAFLEEEETGGRMEQRKKEDKDWDRQKDRKTGWRRQEW